MTKIHVHNSSKRAGTILALVLVIIVVVTMIVAVAGLIPFVAVSDNNVVVAGSVDGGFGAIRHRLFMSEVIVK